MLISRVSSVKFSLEDMSSDNRAEIGKLKTHLMSEQGHKQFADALFAALGIEVRSCPLLSATLTVLNSVCRMVS